MCDLLVTRQCELHRPADKPCRQGRGFVFLDTNHTQRQTRIIPLRETRKGEGADFQRHQVSGTGRVHRGDEHLAAFQCDWRPQS